MWRRFLIWLRGLLPEPERPLVRQNRIQYVDEHGRECVGTIMGPVGLYLDVRPISDVGMQARLIGPDDAVDRVQFWEQWKAWGGELFFEDGRPWEPPI